MTTATPTRRRPHADPVCDRDTWIDAVRAASLTVVVLGHWLLAVVHTTPEGLDAQSLLVATPWARWLTLALQVMGAFFFVGGAVSVASWRRVAGTAGAYPAWLGARLAGLVVPVLPVVLLWAVSMPLLRASGLPEALVAAAAHNALAPLWFLATYVVVQAAIPLIDAVVQRVGWARSTAAALVGSALVDVAARGHDVAWAGVGGHLTVWMVPVVLGVAMADGHLGARMGRRLALAGALGVAVLVRWFGYPVLMVGTVPDGGSNQTPPSLALACLVICHVGLLLATRAPLTRVLARPGARRMTSLAATWSMPVFLWHMSAMVIAIAVSIRVPSAAAGLLDVTPLTTTWWALRPLWWAVMVLWTVPLLGVSVLAGRVLAVRHAATRPGPVLLAAVLGVGALTVGVAGVGHGPSAMTTVAALLSAAVLLGARLGPVPPGARQDTVNAGSRAADQGADVAKKVRGTAVSGLLPGTRGASRRSSCPRR